jgi:hypothetical protein
MGERERERERGKGGRGFYTPSHKKKPLQLYDPECPGKTRKLRDVRRHRKNPRYSGLPRSAPKKISP